MTIEFDREGVERLSIAIIKSACEDYITGKDSESKFKAFCHSKMFSLMTDVEPEYLINAMEKERRNFLNGKKIRTNRHIW